MIARTLKTAALAAALLSAAAVQAQTSAPAASSPAKKELVAKILQLQQPAMEGMARSLLQQPVGNLMQSAGAALQQVPAEKREAAAKAIEGDVRKFVEEATPMLRDRAIKLAPSTIGTLLEERFNEDELKQLAAWMESPVNKKYSQLAPELQNALGQKLVTESRASIEGKLKALEQSVAKHLGLPQQAAPANSPAASKPATKK